MQMGFFICKIIHALIAFLLFVRYNIVDDDKKEPLIMLCEKCGQELDDKAYICQNCGTLTGNTMVKTIPNANRSFVGLILGLIGMIGAVIIPFIGFILGGIGFAIASRDNDKDAKNIGNFAISIGVIGIIINMILVSI